METNHATEFGQIPAAITRTWVRLPGALREIREQGVALFGRQRIHGSFDFRQRAHARQTTMPPRLEQARLVAFDAGLTSHGAGG
jgi:hypothetical protein